jgi:GNAT superfamily N-acetyltransferase
MKDLVINELKIRNAVKSDVPLILYFIKELAEYEKLLHEVTATVELLEQNLFGEKSVAEVVIASFKNKDVGFALYFHNFSTFVGKSGIYLEDLYVSPEYRGKGFGKSLLKYLANLAIERDCGRLEWWVLDWNESAIKFYKSLGAKPMDEWTVFRVAGKELIKLANDEQSKSS